MRIYLSIFLIFLMGLAKVQAQTNEKESVIKNDKIVSSQTLVDALANRIPGARKITDKYGNASIALRGRNSIQTAGDEVLWDIDGVLYSTAPMIGIHQVKYVEIIKGIAAANKYGSEGGAGVIIIKTAVGANYDDLINSPKNLWRTATKKRKKKIN